MNDQFKEAINQVYEDYPVTLMVVYVLLYLVAYPLLKKQWPASKFKKKVAK